MRLLPRLHVLSVWIHRCLHTLLSCMWLLWLQLYLVRGIPNQSTFSSGELDVENHCYCCSFVEFFCSKQQQIDPAGTRSPRVLLMSRAVGTILPSNLPSISSRGFYGSNVLCTPSRMHLSWHPVISKSCVICNDGCVMLRINGSTKNAS